MIRLFEDWQSHIFLKLKTLCFFDKGKIFSCSKAKQDFFIVSSWRKFNHEILITELWFDSKVFFIWKSFSNSFDFPKVIRQKFWVNKLTTRLLFFFNCNCQNQSLNTYNLFLLKMACPKYQIKQCFTYSIRPQSLKSQSATLFWHLHVVNRFIIFN